MIYTSILDIIINLAKLRSNKGINQIILIKYYEFISL